MRPADIASRAYRTFAQPLFVAPRYLTKHSARNYPDSIGRDLLALDFRQLVVIEANFRSHSGASARIGLLLANRGKYGPWEVFSPDTHEAIPPTSFKS